MSRALGNHAEALAAEYLLGLGYTVLARNVVLAHGELDIVARQGPELVFVEVKARRGPTPPEVNITPSKLRTLVRTAQHYIYAQDLVHLPARFDVITLNLGPDGSPPHIRHHIDAFRPDFSIE